MHISLLSITIFILSLLFLFLSFQVIKQRKQHKILYRQSSELKLYNAAQSAHGNFVDYVPYCLVLLILLAMMKLNFVIFFILNGLLILGRILHAYGVLYQEQYEKPQFIARQIGMIFTFFTIIGCSVSLVCVSLF